MYGASNKAVSSLSYLSPQGNALDHPYSPDTPEHVPCQVVGDHYESLARRFHIPVTSDAYVETSTYDEVKDLWTLKAKTPHGYMYAQAKFVVLAAGAGSQRMSMPDLPGRVCCDSLSFKDTHRLHSLFS